jgi:hypothetical protein
MQVYEQCPAIVPQAYAASDLRDASAKPCEVNFPISDAPRAMLSPSILLCSATSCACLLTNSVCNCKRSCGCLTFKAGCAKSIEFESVSVAMDLDRSLISAAC